MATVSSVLQILEQIAPSRYAFGFDKIGLQVGDPSATVTRAFVSLDRSFEAAAQAAQSGAELLLSHHPLLFEPLKHVTSETHVGRTVRLLIRNDINFIAAHTNWDSAQGGVNDALASLLGLSEITAFGSAAEVARLKLVVFVPASHREAVIDAASSAGAGEIGLYSRCAFHAPGTGTYIGGEGANPTIGTAGQIESAQEDRIEMILPLAKQGAVETAVLAVHPYEEPAIDFFVLTDHAEQPAGRIGSIAPISLEEFRNRVSDQLGSPVLAWGDPELTVTRVAVVGGAADGEWAAAKRAGADVFITGEVRQHIALEAAESDMAILAAGHYATEQPGVVALRNRMAGLLPEIEWLTFTPEPGFFGRPF